MFEVTTQAVEVKKIEWSVPKDLEGNVRFGHPHVLGLGSIHMRHSVAHPVQVRCRLRLPAACLRPPVLGPTRSFLLGAGNTRSLRWAETMSSLSKGLRMATWAEFESSDPGLATKGRSLLYQYGPPLGYLATVRPDGPRGFTPSAQSSRRADCGPSSCGIRPKALIFGAIRASPSKPSVRLKLTTSSLFEAAQNLPTPQRL